MVGVIDEFHAASALRYVLAIGENGLVGQTALMADIGEEDECRHVDCEILAVQQQQQFVSGEIPTMDKKTRSYCSTSFPPSSAIFSKIFFASR